MAGDSTRDETTEDPFLSSLICPRRPRGRLLLAVVAAAAGFAAFAGYLESTASSPFPMTSMTAATATSAATATAPAERNAGRSAPAADSRQDRREWRGVTAGDFDADVRPAVAGRVLRRAYGEGALVHRGDLLFQIDPRPFQARLDHARAELGSARDRASAEARQVALDQARLDLESTAVRAPITGVAAWTQARPGDLVNPTSVLVTVSSIDPIRVRFKLSERDYLLYLDGLRPGPAATRHFGELELEPAGGGALAPSPLRGRLVSTDRQVDLASRTIGATGLFPNPGRRLRPGQIATLREPGLDTAQR
jgi:multidrug efflux pump subunit AcrA (membrane-fusion protein)